MHDQKGKTGLKAKLQFLFSPYFLAVAIVSSTFFFSEFTEIVNARLSPVEETAHLFIDGVDYGAFEHINGLSDLTASAKSPDDKFIRVNLKRDFVTAPSLSTWANKSSSGPALNDIRLVMMSKKGHVGASYILKLCKPLSWSLEVAGPAQGGFHEKIELAVQEIAIF